MNTISVLTDVMEQCRLRTLTTLEEIAKLPDPAAVLGWRPGPGRAHIGWQLTHIGITEELTATERMLNVAPAFPDMVPRFKFGSSSGIDRITSARAGLLFKVQR